MTADVARLANRDSILLNYLIVAAHLIVLHLALIPIIRYWLDVSAGVGLKILARSYLRVGRDILVFS